MKKNNFTFFEGLIVGGIFILLMGIICLPSQKTRKEPVITEKSNIVTTNVGEIKLSGGYVYEYNKVVIDGKKWLFVVYKGDHSAFKLIPINGNENVIPENPFENPFEKKGK